MLCLWPQVGHPKKSENDKKKMGSKVKTRPPKKKKKDFEGKYVKFLEEVGKMVGGSFRVERRGVRERERDLKSKRESWKGKLGLQWRKPKKEKQ